MHLLMSVEGGFMPGNVSHASAALTMAKALDDYARLLTMAGFHELSDGYQAAAIALESATERHRERLASAGDDV